MLCLSPITLKHKNPRNKDGKVIVPCGRCVNCLINRRESWVIRLLEEFKTAPAIFITLTYSDENLNFAFNGFATLSKYDVQLFFKRFRKAFKKDFKYYCVGEYGSVTNRPHYHIILFGCTLSDYNLVLDKWGHGQITVTQLNIRRLVYTTKYHLNKGHYPDGCDPPFTLMSKGIGLNYVKTMSNFHDNNIDNCFYQLDQFKKSLPRYYRNKLYSRDELLKMKRKEVNEDDIMKEHYRLNDMNYFKYLDQWTRTYIKKQKEKVNKTTTL
nr:MAG: replication initiator protein [Microvirus sp.]